MVLFGQLIPRAGLFAQEDLNFFTAGPVYEVTKVVGH